MNCENCGAPMVLIGEKEYFFCQYCGSFLFPLQSDEGVRILEPLKKPLSCPVCSDPLYRASINTFPAMHCKKCKGTLLQQFVFGEVVPYLRSRVKGPADRPRLLAINELQRKLSCPYCSQEMGTHPYAGPGNIIIDTCADCCLVWLDYGEISQIANAPGRDRGQPWFVEGMDESFG